MAAQTTRTDRCVTPFAEYQHVIVIATQKLRKAFRSIPQEQRNVRMSFPDRG